MDVMLGKEFAPHRHNVGGFYMSEKLDGMRAIWTGTELLSRNGNKIWAPKWWLDKLPDFPLDGELYIIGATFQDIVSVTRSHFGDWRDVKYMIFDFPTIGGKGGPRVMFNGVVDFIGSLANDVIVPLEQEKLPLYKPIDVIEKKLETVIEGVMLRNPYTSWTPGRTNNLLKWKKVQDAEGFVCGFTEGEGKYIGMMGSLQLLVGTVRVNVSGFTDSERMLLDGWPMHFPMGMQVPFRYREKTKDGNFKEARYKR